MSRILNHTVTACLLGSGVVAWAVAARPLVSNRDLAAPVNPLGIKGSPYGEVFAIAMQGPIDTHFHETARENVASPAACESPASANDSAPESRFGKFLASLDRVSEVRTNPKAASSAHKLFLRREIEDKLRFAYQLDPSHYGNYNALHFFLTEPQLGTRPQLTPSAAKLADETIQYCLKRTEDPRPALTAAAAVTNVLELMFKDQQEKQPKFTTAQMRQYLNLLDYCLGRYAAISNEWTQSRNWELLSPQRIVECEDRLAFICKIRETDLRIIERFEGKAQSPDQASN